MKSAVFSSVAIAALAAFVKADNSTCWMELGQYTTGGPFCVEPLPDFTDEGGCYASQATCVQEYNECKADTISASACLVLNERCQILLTFCTTYCPPDSSGNNPCNCNLSTANAWNGIDTLSTASCASSTSVPAVNVQVASTVPAVNSVPAASVALTLAATSSAVPIPTTTAAAVVAASSTPAAVATPALIAPNVPCGQCFSDPGNGKRAFEQGPNYASSGLRMTIGMCMGICQNKGYKYTGIEFGQECWCGNSFLNGAMPVSAGNCNMTCAGATSQTCGGNLFMNVYQTGCGAPTVPQSTSASSAVINNYASTAVAQYGAKASTVAAYNAGNSYQSSTAVAQYGSGSKSTAAAAVYNAGNSYQSSTVVAQYGSSAKTTAAAAYVAAAASTAATYVTYTPTVGVCSIPTAYATPIGGYHAPIVACNDASNYASLPWKRYNSHYTSTCPTYSSGYQAHACTDACTDQYNSCIANYANTFKTYSSYSAYKLRRDIAPKKEKRTSWYGGYSSGSTSSSSSTKDTYSSATAKCYAQYTACWNANQYLTTSGTCTAGGIFRAPSTQSGYTTYNSGAKSYGSYNTNNNYLTSSSSYSSSSSYGGSTTNNNDYWKE